MTHRPQNEEELDEAIMYWHDVDDTERPLHEYLGWSKEELDKWVKTGDMPDG